MHAAPHVTSGITSLKMASIQLQVNAAMLFRRWRGNRLFNALGLIIETTASVTVLELLSDDEVFGTEALYFGMSWCVVFADGKRKLTVSLSDIVDDTAIVV